MNAAMMARGKDLQPKPRANQYSVLFFIVFTFVVGFTLLSMYAG